MDKMIFVFGSNLAGRHGLGAAKYARMELGAEYWVGEGLTGQCYALPTKDHSLKTRPLKDIEESITKFLACASDNMHKIFKVTPIGCGLAGYKVHEIRALFFDKVIPDNVVFSKEWFQPYKETKVYNEG